MSLKNVIMDSSDIILNFAFGLSKPGVYQINFICGTNPFISPLSSPLIVTVQDDGSRNVVLPNECETETDYYNYLNSYLFITDDGNDIRDNTSIYAEYLADPDSVPESICVKIERNGHLTPVTNNDDEFYPGFYPSEEVSTVADGIAILEKALSIAEEENTTEVFFSFYISNECARVLRISRIGHSEEEDLSTCIESLKRLTYVVGEGHLIVTVGDRKFGWKVEGDMLIGYQDESTGVEAGWDITTSSEQFGKVYQLLSFDKVDPEPQPYNLPATPEQEEFLKKILGKSEGQHLLQFYIIGEDGKVIYSTKVDWTSSACVVELPDLLDYVIQLPLEQRLWVSVETLIVDENNEFGIETSFIERNQDGSFTTIKREDMPDAPGD